VAVEQGPVERGGDDRLHQLVGGEEPGCLAEPLGHLALAEGHLALPSGSLPRLTSSAMTAMCPALTM
jgi:hypothetical protein